jgi:hypothetical protein
MLKENLGVSSKRGPADIRGNTLRVYVYLLRSGASELRDVQRAFGFSTPSLASYHLGRLVEAGYAAQDEHGRYLVVQGAANDILDGYTKLGGMVVPQLLFFATLFSVVVGFFAYMSLEYVAYVPLLVAASAAMVIVLWYETWRLWKRLASWK